MTSKSFIIPKSVYALRAVKPWKKHEIRSLQGWSPQKGSAGDTSATLETPGDNCWGSLLFCFAAWIPWALKMRWSNLKNSIFYGAGTTKWIFILLSWISLTTFLSPDKEELCWNLGHLMDYTYRPHGKKYSETLLNFLESSRSLEVIIHWKIYPNIVSLLSCHIPLPLLKILITGSHLLHRTHIAF